MTCIATCELHCSLLFFRGTRNIAVICVPQNQRLEPALEPDRLLPASSLPSLFSRLEVIWLDDEVVSRGTEGTNRSGRTRQATVQILADCRMKRSHERLWDHVTRSKWGPFQDHAASAAYVLQGMLFHTLFHPFMCCYCPAGGTDLRVSWAEPTDLLFWLRCLDHHKTVSHFQPMLPVQVQARMGIVRDEEGKIRSGRDRPFTSLSLHAQFQVQQASWAVYVGMYKVPLLPTLPLFFAGVHKRKFLHK